MADTNDEKLMDKCRDSIDAVVNSIKKVKCMELESLSQPFVKEYLDYMNAVSSHLLDIKTRAKQSQVTEDLSQFTLEPFDFKSNRAVVVSACATNKAENVSPLFEAFVDSKKKQIALRRVSDGKYLAFDDTYARVMVNGTKPYPWEYSRDGKRKSYVCVCMGNVRHFVKYVNGSWTLVSQKALSDGTFCELPPKDATLHLLCVEHMKSMDVISEKREIEDTCDDNSNSDTFLFLSCICVFVFGRFVV